MGSSGEDVPTLFTYRFGATEFLLQMRASGDRAPEDLVRIRKSCAAEPQPRNRDPEASLSDQTAANVCSSGYRIALFAGGVTRGVRKKRAAVEPHVRTCSRACRDFTVLPRVHTSRPAPYSIATRKAPQKSRERPDRGFPERTVMLYWALLFFIVGLAAAVLGFSGIAFAAAGLAKILFFVFLVLFLVSLVSHISRRI
jgi:uncharacterized membrane protein YtjA (UPF0391 family)